MSRLPREIIGNVSAFAPLHASSSLHVKLLGVDVWLAGRNVSSEQQPLLVD